MTEAMDKIWSTQIDDEYASVLKDAAIRFAEHQKTNVLNFTNRKDFLDYWVFVVMKERIEAKEPKP